VRTIQSPSVLRLPKMIARLMSFSWVNLSHYPHFSIGLACKLSGSTDGSGLREIIRRWPGRYSLR